MYYVVSIDSCNELTIFFNCCVKLITLVIILILVKIAPTITQKRKTPPGTIHFGGLLEKLRQRKTSLLVKRAKLSWLY